MGRDTYLRFKQEHCFGVAAGSRCPIALLKPIFPEYCAVGCCQNVIIYDQRTKTEVSHLVGVESEATTLGFDEKSLKMAVGFFDGSLRIFNIPKKIPFPAEITAALTCSNHGSGITSVAFSSDGTRLISGSRDTTIIVWDLVSERGLFRLRGHKNAITRLALIKNDSILISSSKDTLIKFWDLETQHCFHTVVHHKSEVWDFVVTENDSLMLTGSNDSEIRLFKISEQRGGTVEEQTATTEEKPSLDELIKVEPAGSRSKMTRGRVTFMAVDPFVRKYVAICGADSRLELYRINSDEEIERSLKKKRKKLIKKKGVSEEEAAQQVTRSVGDELTLITSDIRASAVIKAVAFEAVTPSTIKMSLLLSNNAFDRATLSLEKGSVSQCEVSTRIAGHRTDVRTVAFSNDTTAIMSASGESLRIWNRSSARLIRQVPCEPAVCSLFLPGDRHVLLGTKSGHLDLFDLGASVRLESQEAHQDAIWAISAFANQKGFASGSSDKSVKFWQFELATENDQKRITFEHKRTLELDEGVLALKISPDMRLVAVALLDNTVKIFFFDTLKFFLSLYGHSLPVLCLDISSDSQLIATGSADKNLKIWGLDFGDCHKSIFAHDDSLTAVAFSPNTHMVFTAGKDGVVKQWDGDSFQLVNTLKGHFGEVWCLTVSNDGKHVVTAGHDRTLRLWVKSQESLVVTEEKEKELEDEYEAEMKKEQLGGAGDEEVTAVVSRSLDTVSETDRVIEALDILRSTKADPSEKHPLLVALGGIPSEEYLLQTLKKVKSSELESCLTLLPYAYALQLLDFLSMLPRMRENEAELLTRIILFLERLHFARLTSSGDTVTILDRLHRNTLDTVHGIRDMIGFNLSALQYLQRRLEDRDSVHLFADVSSAAKSKKKKKKAVLAVKSAAAMS